MAARVHLINPSHVSFGVAVITPRWLYVLAAATGTAWGDPRHRRRNARSLDMSRHRRGRRRRHRHPYRQRPARLRNRPRGARARRLGGVRRHSRDAVSRRSARARRGARGGQGRRRSRVVDASSRDCFAGTPQPVYDGGRVSRRRVRVGALGSAARRTATCGRRCRPCAAARSTARSARCGGPTARSRGSAASIASSARSSSCAVSASASSRSPTTISIRSRSRTWRRRGADPIRARLHELEALRQERFELMARARPAAGRYRVLHPDHDGSGRGSRRFSTRCGRRTSAARSSASNR